MNMYQRHEGAELTHHPHIWGGCEWSLGDPNHFFPLQRVENIEQRFFYLQINGVLFTKTPYFWPPPTPPPRGFVKYTTLSYNAVKGGGKEVCTLMTTTTKKQLNLVRSIHLFCSVLFEKWAYNGSFQYEITVRYRGNYGPETKLRP